MLFMRQEPGISQAQQKTCYIPVFCPKNTLPFSRRFIREMLPKHVRTHCHAGEAIRLTKRV